MRELPDFSDRHGMRAWFGTQPPEVGIAVAARASLRVLPDVMSDFLSVAKPDEVLGMRLAVFRANLVSAATAMCPADQDEQAKRLQDAARAAAKAIGFALTRAEASAEAAAQAAGQPPHSTEVAHYAARAISFPAHATHHYAPTFPAANAADASRARDDLPAIFDAALWPDQSEVPELARWWPDFRDAHEDDPVWGFWVKWYAAMWHGTPLDWALQTQIALIDNTIWEQGPKAVADKIREIEKNFRAFGANETVAPTEPKTVDQSNVIALFERSPIVTASMKSLSETITARVDLFNRMARPNEKIPFVETLSKLPGIAEAITETISRGVESEGATSQLALEIGQLRAEVERLRDDLKTAHAKIEELQDKPFWRPASVLSGGCISAILCAVWITSGEDVRLEDRWNNVAQDIEFLSNKMWSKPENRIDEPLTYALPESWET